MLTEEEVENVRKFFAKKIRHEYGSTQVRVDENEKNAPLKFQIKARTGNPWNRT